MIILVEGLTNSGKTFFLTRLLKQEWDHGTEIYPNFNLWYDEEKTRINKWHSLPEIYHLYNGIIAIDEAQKLLEARRWASLPLSFAEKIAQHRKHALDIYTTSQSLSHVDKRFRDLIHELYYCSSVFRFPRNERVKPIFQFITVKKKTRKMFADGRVLWIPEKKTKRFFISKYWTKTYYNTYQDIGLSRFLCKAKYEKKPDQKRGKWTAKIYSRELVNSGRARL